MQAQFKIVDDSNDAQMADLRALKEQRQPLSDRAAGLIAARSRLAEAEESERAAVAAIGELGKAEIAAMTEWASKGAAGDPPAPDMVQRRELGERLGGAQAAAAAAKGAATGIEDELASIHTALQGVDDRIETAAREIMAGEYSNVSAEVEAAARAFAAIAAKSLAPRRAIAERGRGLIASGHSEAGMVWLRHAEAMGGTNLPDPLPLVSDIDAAAQEWLQHIGRLIDG